MPLLVVQLPQDTAFPLSSQLVSAVKRCSSEVLKSPAERLGKGSGPKKTSEVLIRSEVVGVAKVANN